MGMDGSISTCSTAPGSRIPNQGRFRRTPSTAITETVPSPTSPNAPGSGTPAGAWAVRSETTTTTGTSTFTSPTMGQTCSIATRGTAPSRTSRPKPAWTIPDSVRARGSAISTTMGTSICTPRTTWSSTSRIHPTTDGGVTTRDFPYIADPKGWSPSTICSTGTTGTAPSPTSPNAPESIRSREPMGWALCSAITTTTASSTSMWPTIRRRTSCTRTTGMGRSRRWG